ncbi:LuxR C-terminal-related transcriptional regulator [Paenisporosarcina indica]|uniref:LuxR C-terminal-related transcriptional regulator n=1 Tax=Paenisporosarcina indica TaxID=650093 RepID=UPI0009FBC769|nr:LuxR C-terminal-related transcriptional regulator [Paenisporosarcina indica]
MNLFDSTLSEIKNGYTESGKAFTCLLCGKSIEKGMVYQREKQFFEAYKFIQLHIEEKHGSVFSYLIEQDKEITGLSEQHKAVMQQMFEGKSDREIQEVLQIGSASTVRNHRFSLKKKEKQAKVLLTLMSFINELDRGRTNSSKPSERGNCFI